MLICCCCFSFSSSSFFLLPPPSFPAPNSRHRCSGRAQRTGELGKKDLLVFHGVFGSSLRAVAMGLMEVKLKTKSGSWSPSWAAWLRTCRSTPWRRSTCSPCPLRNPRLLTFPGMGHHLDQAFHYPCAERLLGEQDW